MQIKKIIPDVVENKNTKMRNKSNPFPNLESGLLLFPYSWYNILSIMNV